MHRWFIAVSLGSLAACTLLVDTSGLSGGEAGPPGAEGGAQAPGDGAPGADGEASAPPACNGGPCAGPLPPCDGPCQPVVIATETGALLSIAADETGVYWPAPGPGDVRRASVDGSNLATIFHGGGAPSFVALDDTSVFWTESNSGRVRAASKAAVNATTPAAEVSGQPTPYALAVGGGAVFWHDNATTHELRTASASLSGASTIAPLPGNVFALGADASFLYAGVGGGVDVVQRTPRAAPGAFTDVTPKQNDLRAFAVDATRVFYTSKANGVVASNTLASPSTSTIVYGSTEGGPNGLAVDSTHVYWANTADGRIRRAFKGTGPPETLAAGQVSPTMVAVNSVAVYWLAFDGVKTAVMTLRKP